MDKLSKREKVLLYLLALIVIVAGMVWLVITPAVNQGEALDTSISDALVVQADMQGVIAQRPVIDADIADYTARIKDIEDNFLPKMTNDDLDRYITGLLQRSGLTAEALAISAGTDLAEAPGIETLYVKITASGALDQFVSLAETVSRTSGIRITDLILRAGDEKPVAKTVPSEGDPTVTTEVTQVVNDYAVSIGFTVIEYDASVVDALLPEA